MSSIDKLCLNWNEFQEKVCIGFSALRKDSEFADVTLACEDGSIQVGRGAKLAKSPAMQAAQLSKSKKNWHLASLNNH